MDKEHRQDGSTPPTNDGAAARPPTDCATPDLPQGRDERAGSLRALPRLVATSLWILWRAGRRELITMVVLQLVSGASLGLVILVGGQVFDGVMDADRASGGFSDFLPSVLLLLVVTGLLGFVSAAAREQEELLRDLTNRYTQDRVLDVGCAVELEAFERPGFHDRLARAQANGATATMNITNGLARLIAAVTGAAGVIVALFTLEPLLVPLALLVFVPAYLVSSRRGEAYYRFTCEMTANNRERLYMAELLTRRETAAEVRAFGLPSYLRRRYDRLWDDRLRALRGVVRRQLGYQLLANLGIMVIIGGTLAVLVALALNQKISLADAIATAGAIVILGTRLVDAGFGLGSLYEASLFVDDFMSFVAMEPELARARVTTPAPSSFSKLTVEDVSFTYPSGSQPALNNVSLHLDKGEVVALVGENGSGKTTLAKLLCGLFVPDSGRILWDGGDIAAYNADGIRRAIGVIFQDFVHYQLPARDNIAIGDHDQADNLDGIMAAARWSGIDVAFRRLPNGYDTMLGPPFEGGTDLSIGQWQRVALARAFFRNAPFIILDEPTAALDAKAEHELFTSIRALFGGRTVLLISHRFSSVRAADRIYVMDKGAITETGSHEDLMAQGGRYAEMFTLQASAYLDGKTIGADSLDGVPARGGLSSVSRPGLMDDQVPTSDG